MVMRAPLRVERYRGIPGRAPALGDIPISEERWNNYDWIETTTLPDEARGISVWLPIRPRVHYLSLGSK